MVLNAAFLLDQMGHAVGRPQAGFIPESLRAALQPPLDPLDIFRTEPRPAAGPTRFAESLLTLLANRGRPLTHRLAMGPNLPGHFRLAQPLLEQLGRLHTPPFQGLKISTLSRWKPHASHHSMESEKCQYIIRK
jgi:hypothetical protein